MNNYKNLLEKMIIESSILEFNTINLFTWSSGIQSPIYTDCRKIYFDTNLRSIVLDRFICEITNEYDIKIDAIAGVATGSIGHAILVAHEMAYPFIYIRPKSMNHGLCKSIEGVDSVEGTNILVIEDLVSTGNSSMKVIDELKNNGANVIGLMSIFQYGLKKANDLFFENNIKYTSLTTLEKVLDIAIGNGYINDKMLSIIKQFIISLDKNETNI